MKTYLDKMREERLLKEQEELKEVPRCSYRNCVNIIQNRRSHSKYCCEKCKTNEKTYLKREKKEKMKTFEMIMKAKEMNVSSDILELYKKIYG